MEKHSKQLIEWIQLNSERIPKEVINEHFLLSVQNNDELLEFYLLMGADPNSNKNQAMLSAVNSGDLDRIKLLQRYGGDVNVNLSEAIKANNIQLVRYMLESGAQIMGNYLYLTISAENIDMLKLFLRYGAEVDHVDMQKAAVMSLKIVKILLPYTKRKFPIDTFHDGDSAFGYFESLPSDVLKFVLDNLNKKNGVMSDIISDASKRIYDYPRELNFRLKLALNHSIKQSNATSMKLLVEYFEKNNMSFSTAYDESTCSVLVQKSKSVEDLNHILLFLKEHHVWQEIIKFSDYLPNIYSKCNLQTLEILNITPSQECFEPAIKNRNKSFIEALLNLGIKPKSKDVDLAFNECNSYYRDDEKYKLCTEIVKLLVKAEP